MLIALDLANCIRLEVELVEVIKSVSYTHLEVLNRIAELVDGGMRDAIGMLDKAISYSSDSKVSLTDFEMLNGIVSKTEKKKFLSMIFEQNISEIISFIDAIYDAGKDLVIFNQDLLTLCRDLVVDYYSS